MTMKRGVMVIVYLLGAVLCSGTAWSEGSVSSRPEVRKNFQQLMESRGCRGCDLSGAVLNRIDLSGMDLEGANLSGVQLYMATLAGTNLKNANLQGAALGGADLAGADLTGANLTGAILEGAYLVGATMDGKVEVRRPYMEEGGPEAGEVVFVDDEKRSKKLPFTNQVVAAAPEDIVTEASVAGQDKPKTVQQMNPASVPVADSTPAAAEVEIEKESAARVDEVQPVVQPAQASEQEVTASAGEGDSGPEGLAAPVTPDGAVQAVAPVVAPETVADTAEQQAASDSAVAESAAVVPAPTPEPVAPPAAVTPTPEPAARETVGKEAVDPEQALKNKSIDLLLEENRCVGCDLTGVDLSGRRLKAADLERANLQGANLRNVNLRGANLKGAHLRDADLRDADLREADLYRANLSGADLTGARFDEALMDSVSADSAVGANFEGALQGK